jgi:hypothetical protein
MSDTWETSDGKIIPIQEMTDSHLENSIEYLFRKSWPSKANDKKLQSLFREKARRQSLDDPDGPMEPAMRMLEMLGSTRPKNGRIDPDDAVDWEDDPGMGQFFEQQ